MHRVLAVTVDQDGRADAHGEQAILVPTTGAREALRRTLHRIAADRLVRVDILTRDELYDRLHAAAARRGPIPELMSGFEREALLGRAAQVAEKGGSPAPFRLRPGLLVEVLAFYDELRRRDKTVSDFDRLMTGSLEPSVAIDRGAERMFRQTRFLTSAFDAFESLIAASGRFDEHGLRQWLLEHDEPSPFWRVTITVADQAADARGLWTADYDLLARLSGLQRIDIVATENLLAAGFHQRIHDLLPGIVEERGAEAGPAPVLIAPDVPPGADAASAWFLVRDREEELAAIARGDDAIEPTDRAAVVFQRPLPYLYLARYVFGDAGRPYQAVDAFPLAGEPFAAGLDLVFAFLITEANRASTIDLLSSQQWRFPELAIPTAAPKACVAALDARLRELKYLGDWTALADLADSHSNPELRPVDAAVRAAANAAEALRPVREAPSASEQFRSLLGFIDRHEIVPDPAAPWSARHLRARRSARRVGVAGSRACAHDGDDDEPPVAERLAGIVRRWIEGQTFAPVTGTDGVWLLDAAVGVRRRRRSPRRRPGRTRLA